MERINLTKFGFIRNKEADFSDDGNRFTCYMAGNVEVSKLVADGDVYIAGRINDYSVPYETYSQLPHYRSMDKLNGVRVSSITEEDLKEFYNDCIAYSDEFAKAAATIVYPATEDIRAKCEKINKVRQAEYDEISGAIANAGMSILTKLDEYWLKSLASAVKSLQKSINTYDLDLYPIQIQKTAYSFSFIKDDYKLGPSYDYRRCKEILEKLA